MIRKGSHEMGGQVADALFVSFQLMVAAGWVAARVRVVARDEGPRREGRRRGTQEAEAEAGWQRDGAGARSGRKYDMGSRVQQRARGWASRGGCERAVATNNSFSQHAVLQCVWGGHGSGDSSPSVSGSRAAKQRLSVSPSATHRLAAGPPTQLAV